MKQFFPSLALALLPLGALAQAPDTLINVRTVVGTSKVTRLYLAKTGGFLLGGDYDGSGFGSILAEGPGTRLLWYPEKAAFRAGYITGTHWDDYNVGVGSVAGGYNNRASGQYGTAFGYSTTASNIGSTALGQYCTASGASSVALGQYCTASGAATVALGYYAHTNIQQGSFVFADRSVVDDGNSLTDESFRAPVNHSANWRVTGGFRVVTAIAANAGSYTPTRGVSILPSSMPSNSFNTAINWGQQNALIATSSGAYLSDGGTWTNSSDRHKKHLFEAVSGEDVLTRLRRVPMQRWSYKTESAQVRHLGPMAQDFRRAFGLGPDSVSIGTVDADGVALAGVQALDARTRTQAAALTALQAENQALRARLDTLERPVTPAGLPLGAGLVLAGAVLGGLVAWRRKPAPAGR